MSCAVQLVLAEIGVAAANRIHVGITRPRRGG
jgi:hypothetical protein